MVKGRCRWSLLLRRKGEIGLQLSENNWRWLCLPSGYHKTSLCLRTIQILLTFSRYCYFFDVYWSIVTTKVYLALLLLCNSFCKCRCSLNRHLLLDNENTGRASNDYFVYALPCCVRSDPVVVVLSLIIETLLKKVWLFWFPKNIPSQHCPGKDILHGFTVSFMFPSIKCEFTVFKSL